jgi:hypothetical protein
VRICIRFPRQRRHGTKRRSSIRQSLSHQSFILRLGRVSGQGRGESIDPLSQECARNSPPPHIFTSHRYGGGRPRFVKVKTSLVFTSDLIFSRSAHCSLKDPINSSFSQFHILVFGIETSVRRVTHHRRIGWIQKCVLPWLPFGIPSTPVSQFTCLSLSILQCVNCRKKDS